LEQEKAEVQAEFDKKLAEIEEMHKEIEEKANQINTLCMELDDARFLNI
jgi:peptidoglycan hydrolase CwlO-like protein